jgi:hypothetical protein
VRISVSDFSFIDQYNLQKAELLFEDEHCLADQKVFVNFII